MPFCRNSKFNDNPDTAAGRKALPDFLRRGSMTAEAALAVPFFFLCMLGLFLLLDHFGVLAARTVELQVKAEQQAKAQSLLSGGLEYADILKIKSARIRGFPFPVPEVRCPVRGRARAWIGGGEDTWDASGSGGEYVYVTDHESVYHTSPECSHLELSIIRTTPSGAAKSRNRDGKKYHACEKCAGHGDAGGSVYISPSGDRYHTDEHCSGLTRHVRLTEKDSLGGLRECSRCRQLEAEKEREK